MVVIRQDSVPDVIANKCRSFIDTHVRYRTISDNLHEQKIYIFTDNYLDNQRDKKTNSKNRIGQRVKELRKAHNLTQKTLAAKLQLAGYDFNDLAILRIEQGTRFVPDYEVVALAEVFNVSCEYLLGLTDAPAK